MAGVDASGVEEFKRAVAEMEAKKRDAVMGLLEGVLQSRDQRVVAVEDGTGNALATRVNTDNNLGVEARYGRDTVTTTFMNVGPGPVQLVGTMANRVQLTVQNLHDVNWLWFRLGTAVVAGQDMVLFPGEMYSLPPGAAYEGPVFGVSSGAITPTVVVQYRL